MAKSPNQKLKLLYIMKFLLEHTDENHKISTQELVDKLAAYDISAERKSIYDDVDKLIFYGMDIIKEKGSNPGYYVASREFELAELKLLVDAVQSSKFITEKKSNELIKKLEGLASNYEAKQLQRQVHVANRVKSMNESIYYNIDDIHKAIADNSKIEFKYFKWNMSKELVPRKDGKVYVISPWVLIWDDENYYMVGYDAEADTVKHFRVDKMREINSTGARREGADFFKNGQLGGISTRTFGMYTGEEKLIRIEGREELAGVIIDRFGKDVSMRRIDDEHFSARLNVVISPQFYGWLTGLGTGIKIVEPEDVRDDYKAYLNKIINQ